MVNGKMLVTTKGFLAESRKIKNLIKQLELAKKKDTKTAAELMTRTARILAGNRTGRMRSNINMFRRGSGRYEVVSSRWSLQNEWQGSPDKQYRFPVHLWMEGLVTGSRQRKLYSAVTNKTGTFNYWTKAKNKSSSKFVKIVRNRLTRALSVKIS